MPNGGAQTEELRGILVLGIIGTLLSIAQLAPKVELLGIPFVELTYWLIAYWGSYLFFAVIGISRDWINESVARVCYEIASMTFVSGIGFIVGLIPVFLINSVPALRIIGSAILLIPVAFGIGFLVWIRKPGWKQFSQ
jgi:hypothetical protein